MRELGSTIECYRGEAFTIRREFVDADGAPLIIPANMRNPFIRFTVKSNTYRIDGEYKKNYWTDLSDFDRRETAILGPAEPKTFVDVSKTIFTASEDTKVQQGSQGMPAYFYYQPPTQTEIYQMYIVADKLRAESTRRLEFKIRAEDLDMSNVVLKLLGDDGEILDQTNLLTMSLEQETYTFLLDKPYNRRLYILFSFSGGFSPGGLYNLSLQNVLGEYDTNQLYYRITEAGREYYTVDYLGNEIEQPYKFEYVRKFLNADTRKWVGQQYQYEIALCSGELMLDWLKRTYQSLYPGIQIPTANEELAHYICKKRPDLLEGVNIHEPLVSYQTNKVLQGPSKLIVKEN